ncbi:MAG: DUF1549 domain-containing protein [Planctomycetota bacterium]
MPRLLQRAKFAIALTLAYLVGISVRASDEPAASVASDDGKHISQYGESEVLFVRRIHTLLTEKCVGCHGADEEWIEGMLDMRSLPPMLKGGDSGEAAIVPGKPEASPIYLAARRGHDFWSDMPPKEAESLTEDQLSQLARWIETGAAWPDTNRYDAIRQAYDESWSAEDGIVMVTSGGLSSDWTQRRYDPEGMWAYQQVVAPEIDETSDDLAIDHLIKTALPSGLPLAPRADRATLLRRATFDLTGLPPTLEEHEAFVKDPRDDRTAFADVVERLLQSPHYGERMAQHWLDVVRFADSSGFANDYERGNAWRYRDYVVRSFNSDKPYDQFVREQIAGDEMGNDPESVVATGFLRMGPWELTSMEVAKIARQRFLDDVTNSVGETFLGHSLQCARCHDHKFDPVPTRDYYSIQAVFATTQLAERRADFSSAENCNGFNEREVLHQRREHYERTLTQIDQILLENAQQWFLERDVSPEKWNEAVDAALRQGKSSVFGLARQALRRQGIDESQYPPKKVGLTTQQFGLERVARKGLQRLKWEFERYEPYALAVYSGRTNLPISVHQPMRVPKDRLSDGELEATCILTGGDSFASGPAVQPGTLSVLDSIVSKDIPDTIQGRRIALANWIADPANPLTTRVIANRIWQWHFGQAIAGNPNNFGSSGKRPTHPKLLDWLATSLVEDGWSIKSMHRRIMASDAYARSSHHPNLEQLEELDPLRTSMAVFNPRRLTGEEIRDAMLSASGELNPTLGGIPCRPVIHPEVALQPRQVMGTFAAAWTHNPTPQQRNRRSLYVLRLRGLTHPMLEVFNMPSADFSCERRELSTVTTQVFALLNGQAIHQRALALAQRAASETNSDEAAIKRCFQLAFTRLPTADETRVCLDHWRTIQTNLPSVPVDHVMPPKDVRREAVEENTGERFTFMERLYGNDHFQPDLRPVDVTPRVRALGDVCLALFNANEFVYVY